MIRRLLSPITAALIVFAMSAAAVPAVASAGPTLGDVRSLADLETLFAADRGKYRIVLLLSPT